MRRWFRNHGFVFNELQVFARWDDIGGPRPYELWTLSSRWRYATHRAWLHGVSGAAGALIAGLLLGAERNYVIRFATIMLLGGSLAMFFAAAFMERHWKRRRNIYDRWLQRRAYLDAKATAKAASP